ncbi:MAG: hypothetical protein AAFU55_08505 [Pseudomonadota bacterium]
MTPHRIDVLGSINVDLSTTAPRLPAPGETLTLQIERILTGTCTPEIVTVVEG